MKPIIGMIEWPYYDKDGDIIYEVLTPIIEWIVRCGGRPIGIFPSQIEDFVQKRLSEISELSELEQKELKETIDLCDGIIKPGALKIYEHERKIYEYCYKENIPYLGICAGMQLMASYGVDNIKNERNDSDVNHHSKDIYSHKITLQEATLLKKIIQLDEIMVNSRHNYHVTNSGLHVVGAKAIDGVIEAIEAPDKIFHIGLQWHPELLPKEDCNSEAIFGEFVEASKQYRKRIK